MTVSNTEPSWIWILEDHVDLRAVMAILAENEGYAVVEIATLDEAERIYSNFVKYSRFPRIVISDYQLTDGNTEEFLLRCRKAFPDVPICCISGELNRGLRFRFREAGIRSICKPVTLVQLMEILLRDPQ